MQTLESSSQGYVAYGYNKCALSRWVAGYRFMGKTLAFFCCFNLIVYFVISRNPSLLESLALTPSQPYGIVTASFAHRDITHLAGNLVLFSIITVFFMSVNISLDLNSRKIASKIFCYGSFVAGFVTCAAQFVNWKVNGVSGTGAYGSSGVVYGAAGILLASAVYNIFLCTRSFRSRSLDSAGVASPDVFFAAAFSIHVIGIFTYLPVFQREMFFFVNKKVAWNFHEVGFLIGFSFSLLLLSLSYFWVKYRMRNLV